MSARCKNTQHMKRTRTVQYDISHSSASKTVACLLKLRAHLRQPGLQASHCEPADG